MTQITRCKMVCHGVTANEHQPGMHNVQLGAVWSPQTGTPLDENQLFGKLTPFGQFSACMVASAAAQFVVGREYYVDIQLASTEQVPEQVLGDQCADQIVLLDASDEEGHSV